MPPFSFELRERFHLTLLYYLSLRLAQRPYAVKGGICLRFFHRSQRLSEDMDIDVSAQMRQKTLEDAVDSIIESRSFKGALLAGGISRIEARKPKQTETTQRWKFTLHSRDIPLPTKVEFSRRSLEIPFTAGIPDASLLKAHQMHPFAARFYGAEAMCALKIQALAAPNRFALRDLFDLDHLFASVSSPPEAVKKWVEPEETAKAAEKIGQFHYGDFQEQVLPYLDEALMGLYSEPAAFVELKKRVEDRLLEIME